MNFNDFCYEKNGQSSFCNSLNTDPQTLSGFGSILPNISKGKTKPAGML
jgi:hypothetical protein